MIAVLDVAAGLLIAAAGVLGWRAHRTSAMYAIAAAVTWFAATTLPFFVLVHRPLLVQATLALPRGGLRGRLPRVLIALTWTAVVLPPRAQPWASLTIAAFCVVVAGRVAPPRARDLRPDEVATRRALLLLSAGLTLPVLERLVWPTYAEVGLPLATYLCAVALCAIALIMGMLAPVHDEDDVIELSNNTPAQALGELRRLVETESDPARLRALGSAVDLLEDNARLQRDLAERIHDVRASRVRLIGTAIDERRRIERVLADGAVHYLNELEACLRTTTGHAAADPTALLCLEEVARTRDDLEQLARGLHPRILAGHGLGCALKDLGRRSPLPVEVSAPPGRFPELVETTIWYVCAEALANVWKHAHANRATLHVSRTTDGLRAEIRDDGHGGAALIPGGGLAGLTDRLSVVRGRLSLSSTPAGTELVAEVPLP